MDKKTFMLTLAAFFIFVTAYILSEFACDQNKQSKNRRVSDEWVKIRTAKSFQDIFKVVEEINLTGEIVTGIAQLIVLPSHKIILSDRKEVMLFQADGRFIRTIGKIGQGPGEYLKSMDFTVDDSLNIFILDDQSLRVSVFDTLGQYKRQYRMEKRVDEMAISGDKLYFYSAVNMYRDYMGYCYEMPGRRVSFDFAPPTELLKRFKSNMIPPFYGFVGYLRAYGEKIYIVHPYEYTIRVFSLNGKELRQIKGKSRHFVPNNPAKKFDITIPPSEFLNSLIKTFLIWNDMIFVFFGDLRSQDTYIDIYSLDGEQINDSTIVLKGRHPEFNNFFVPNDRSGYFYSYYQPKPKSPLEVPNPVLIKYKFLQ